MAWRRSRQQRINLLLYVIIVAAILYFFGFDFLPSNTSHDEEPELQWEEVPPKHASAPKKPSIPQPAPVVKEETTSKHAAVPVTQKPAPVPGEGDIEMVVASMTKENTTWLYDYLLDWKKNIYVVDDPTAALTVPMNKGREAMVFLT